MQPQDRILQRIKELKEVLAENESANIDINAPLALQQCNYEGSLQALKWAVSDSGDDRIFDNRHKHPDIKDQHMDSIREYYKAYISCAIVHIETRHDLSGGMHTVAAVVPYAKPVRIVRISNLDNVPREVVRFPVTDKQVVK